MLSGSNYIWMKEWLARLSLAKPWLRRSRQKPESMGDWGGHELGISHVRINQWQWESSGAYQGDLECLLKKNKKNKKNAHRTSWELCFIQGHYWELYSPGYSLSDSSEELFQRGKRAAWIYKSFCWNKTKHVVERGKIIANHKKKQTSQVNDFSAFLCLGRCESLGLLKLLLWYAS